MANLSPVTQAIESIAQCLANAATAARAIDVAASQDLRSLLHIAGREAERVRRATRKARIVKKLAVKAPAKSPAKRVRAAVMKVAPQQTKSRRKAASPNGIAH